MEAKLTQNDAELEARRQAHGKTVARGNTDGLHGVRPAVKARDDPRPFKLGNWVKLASVACLQCSFLESQFNRHAKSAFSLKLSFAALVASLVLGKL